MPDGRCRSPFAPREVARPMIGTRLLHLWTGRHMEYRWLDGGEESTLPRKKGNKESAAYSQARAYTPFSGIRAFAPGMGL